MCEVCSINVNVPGIQVPVNNTEKQHVFATKTAVVRSKGR